MMKHFTSATIIRILTHTLAFLLCMSASTAQETVATDKALYRLNAAKQAEKEAASKVKNFAGISVDDNYSAEELIRDIFIAGGCFDVQNISFSGDAEAKGRFANGTSSIGIEDGIILSTGRIQNAVGPNNSNAESTRHDNLCNDPSLLSMVDGATNQIWDCAVIEFDFIPTTDMVSFEYAFASEEYCEFAGDEYNDVFGFFISGPGISGNFANNAKNIALLPNSNTYVTINSINHFTNEAYYVPNERQFNAISCGKPFEAEALNDIEYDGMTKVLTAETSVIPCETYHIRLIIGDGGDAIYDSAVFLKANSFNAGGTASAMALSTMTSSNTVYESCNDGYFVFERTSEDLDVAIDVNFVVNPSSTATAGLDFETLPTSVTIPAGEMQYILPVNILSDDIAEGAETLIIEIDNACSCSIQNTELIINETPLIDVEEMDFSVCEFETIDINPIPSSNSTLPLTYDWSDGSTSPNFSTMATSSTTYSVTISDPCGQSIVANYQVDVTSAPTANLEGEVALCDAASTAELTIALDGNGPWNIVYNIDGVAQDPIETSTPTYVLEVNQAGIYTLESVEANACLGEAKGTAIVQQSDMELAAATQVANCYNNGLGSIEIIPSGTTGPYSFSWDADFGDTANPQSIEPDTYEVVVTDNLGCTQVQSVTLEDNISYPEGDIAPTEVITCSTSTVQINGSVFSSETNNTLYWSTPDGNILSGANSLSPTVDQAGNYTLTITNADNGCATEIATFVEENIVLPQGTADVSGELTCINETVNVFLNPSGAANIAYEWTTTDGNILQGSDSDNLLVNEPGIYQVVFTDMDNQCTNTALLEVVENTVPPTVALAEPEQLTCATREVDLEATIESESTTQLEWEYEGEIIENLQNNTDIAVTEAGLYTLVVTNQENGCSAQDQMLVVENTNYPTLLQTDSTVPACKGDFGSIQIFDVEGGEAPYMYSIDGGLNFFTESDFQNVPAGTYDLMVQDLNGCELESLFVLPDGNEPSLQLDPEVELRLGDDHRIIPQINITEEQIDSIQWYPAEGLDCTDCLTPTVLPTNNSNYTLTIVDENGCSSEANIAFRVSVEKDIYIPNAFSPHNGDGVNDIFQLYARENLVSEIVKMQVFDRWGTLVYQADHFEPNGRMGWNGLFKNKKMQAGVYIYYFEIRLINNTVLTYSGDVTIVD